MTPDRVVGRLAPSPTGGLHVGHARTFLVAWLAVRSRGGRLILRIEDIDAGRVRPGAAEAAIADLAWLGIDWDEGPIHQSTRFDHYRAALEGWIARGLVYPCTCTRAEIERAASAPHAGEEGPTYPGSCASRTAEEGVDLERRGIAFAWRFRTDDRRVGWNDLVVGPIERGLGGDFIIAREPFAPSYQLAVSVDDALMGVTQVLRGDDLIPSTPRQIRLLESLEARVPHYGHIPLVHDADGRRLAKRDGSIKLAALREAGIDPRRLIGYLARSCGWTDGIEPSSPRDWIDRFELRSIPPEPWTLVPPHWPPLGTRDAPTGERTATDV
ncbi:MAG: tRNA glutamyl-Q(34) synthetase GluQRS [Isosphaeraceae bacterium]|nr:tRNA glutamyl-Q(34) synthetase GluQRS [Isosphaeraceae bacterium]